MTVGTTIVRVCKECGNEFAHVVKGSGRHPDYCETHRSTRNREAVRRYRQTEKGRKAVQRQTAKKKETYDPWLWENTILEWNE